MAIGIMLILYIIPLIGCLYTYDKCSITYIVNSFSTRNEMLMAALIPILNIYVLYKNLKDIIKNEL